MAEHREDVSTYLLAASLVSTVLLFTLRPTSWAQVTVAGAALAWPGYLLVRFIAAPHTEQDHASIGDRRPAWLTWTLTPFAVWLLLAIGRLEVSTAVVSGIGLVVTAGVLVVGAGTALRAANQAALFLVSASLLVALLNTRYVVSGARHILPILYDGRAFGLLQHPNGLGQMSALLFMLAWNRRSRVGFLVSVVGLLAAASQTALLAVLTAGLCVFGARLLRTISVRYRPVLAFLGAGFALLFFWLVAAKALTLPILTVSQDDLTLTKRTIIWQELTAGGVPPLGLGGDGLAARLAARTLVGSAHNMWLEAWLRDGIPGVVALVIAVLVLVKVAGSSIDPALALGGAVLLIVEGATESASAHPIFFPFYVSIVALAATVEPCSAVGTSLRHGAAGPPLAAS